MLTSLSYFVRNNNAMKWIMGLCWVLKKKFWLKPCENLKEDFLTEDSSMNTLAKSEKANIG